MLSLFLEIKSSLCVRAWASHCRTVDQYLSIFAFAQNLFDFKTKNRNQKKLILKLYAKLIYRVPSEQWSSHPDSINLTGCGYRNKHAIINVQLKQRHDKYLKQMIERVVDELKE